MPEIAPWLQAARPADYYGKGYAESAAIAQANARLQAAQMQHQAQLQMQQQRLDQQKAHDDATLEAARIQQERNYLMSQQRMEMQRAYHDAQTGLAQNRLDETKRANDLRLMSIQGMEASRKLTDERERERIAETKRVNAEKTLKAARQYEAMQETTRLAGQPGADPFKIILANAANLGVSGNNLVSLAKAAELATIPENVEIKEEGGEKFYRRGRYWSHIPRPAESHIKERLDAGAVASLRSEIKTIEENLAKGLYAEDAAPNKEAQVLAKKRQVNQYYKDNERSPLYPEAEPKVDLWRQTAKSQEYLMDEDSRAAAPPEEAPKSKKKKWVYDPKTRSLTKE